MLCLVAQSCPTLCHPMDCSPLGSSVLGDSPGNNTGVGCHALLQEVFLTQGSNPGLPQADSLPSEADLFLTNHACYYLVSKQVHILAHRDENFSMFVGVGDIIQPRTQTLGRIKNPEPSVSNTGGSSQTPGVSAACQRKEEVES